MMSDEPQVPEGSAPEGGASQEEKRKRRRFRPWRRRHAEKEGRAAAEAGGAELPAEAVPDQESRRPAAGAPGLSRERDSAAPRRGQNAPRGRQGERRSDERGSERGNDRGSDRGNRPAEGDRGRRTRFGRPRPVPGEDRPAGASPASAGVKTPQVPREILRSVPPRGVLVAPPSPPLKVLIAGGGTGGHIYPALAVADEVRRRNKESRILFVGTKRGLESRLVPESGYDIEYLDLSGFAGRNPVARVIALIQLTQGIFRMKEIVRRFQPEIVLGTGGYVSGPAVLAAHWAGIPTIIQEQNSIPGKMNRFLARFVDEVHVAYTESRHCFKQTSKIRLSGNPARIRQPRGSLLALYRKFELDAGRMTVLIIGGSRGARSLNRAAVEMMPLLAGRSDLQFIIQTGQDDLAMVQSAAQSARVRAVVRAYFAPIEEIYALATIAVCRAGAMTLAEIAQFGLPAILVPFPFAIYQHQLMNARILAEKGAAEVVLDKDLSGKVLSDRIETLLADKERRREMGLNAWNLARPDAHERLVNSIEALTHPVEKKGAADLVETEPVEMRQGRH